MQLRAQQPALIRDRRGSNFALPEISAYPERSMRNILLLLFMGSMLTSQAVQLRVHGTVTDLESRAPLAQALVRVYKDGVKLESFHTGDGGRYSVLLENNAEYIIRFSQPGRVTKCYAVDTHGPAWEGDGRVVDLAIEMTLFEMVPGLDLSFFDLPMGMARFTPMTGYLSWNDTYAQRVRPEVDRLMAEVALRRQTLAAVASRSALVKPFR